MNIVSGQPLAKAIGSTISGFLTGISTISKESTGSTDDSVGKTITWFLIFVVLPSIFVIYYGRDNPNTAYILFLLVIVSTLIGFVAGFVIALLAVLILIVTVSMLVFLVARNI